MVPELVGAHIHITERDPGIAFEVLGIDDGGVVAPIPAGRCPGEMKIAVEPVDEERIGREHAGSRRGGESAVPESAVGKIKIQRVRAGRKILNTGHDAVDHLVVEIGPFGLEKVRSARNDAVHEAVVVGRRIPIVVVEVDHMIDCILEDAVGKNIVPARVLGAAVFAGILKSDRRIRVHGAAIHEGVVTRPVADQKADIFNGRAVFEQVIARSTMPNIERTAQVSG